MIKSKAFLQGLIKAFVPKNSRGQKEEDLEKIAAQEQKQFQFQVLVAATKNFHRSNKLGEGGFGPVYKGKLDDGREIAVKKLSQSSRQGKKEFMNEAKLLARVQHRNVVNLLGYCAHGPEKLLVYEFVVNESLDKLLFIESSGRDALDWNRRHDIILGVAKGLLYLHEDAHSCIIHRDIKASNILLDDKYLPKIADFGLARLFNEDGTHVNTRAAGTNGYMAPEYVMHGNLSIKADVYSFGVVILELISGQKNSTFNRDTESTSLLEWIGLLCVQSDPRLRPDMRRVVVMLSRKPGTLEEPTRPGYPGSRYRKSHKPFAVSSATGTSGASNSHSFTSTTKTNSVTATTTTSALTNPRSDRKGKRPMHYST
ncbi:cysteine-rich receptor-like protein kinase 43 isoform X3 [Coffea arabica]|uniref:Cysteine-rich receptor-like protein kinase 43 isoform X3 n=1 Tax=Coffea arabica TaxID=13443 RepID=A0A6P6VCX2_COFAR